MGIVSGNLPLSFLPFICSTTKVLSTIPSLLIVKFTWQLTGNFLQCGQITNLFFVPMYHTLSFSKWFLRCNSCSKWNLPPSSIKNHFLQEKWMLPPVLRSKIRGNTPPGMIPCRKGLNEPWLCLHHYYSPWVFTSIKAVSKKMDYPLAIYHAPQR